MPKFFIETGNFESDTLLIEGEDAVHIGKVLRMKAGDSLIVSDCKGYDYSCIITELNSGAVTLKINERRASEAEPSVSVTLFQGLPKGDKMDTIVQKSVELGVTQIVPVITKRSVSRPDAKSLLKKAERWNKIAAEAAKQSGRGILPTVREAVDFTAALEMINKLDIAVMLYEHNGGTLGSIFNGKVKSGSIGIMVGPEGGFDDNEVEYARIHDILTAGMGPRILRTETAPICALSVIMFATGNI